MALLLRVNTVTKDAGEITVLDYTTYTTPARADLYSNFYAYKVDENDVATAAAVASQGDPTSILEWTVTTPVDGYYRFILISYPQWDVGDSYVIGDKVWDIDTYYICTADVTGGNNPATNASFDVTTNTADDVDVANIETGTLDCILFYRLKQCFAKEVAEVAATECLCDIDKKPVNIQKYERYGVLIDGIAVDNYQQRFTEGEVTVQYMTKLCNC